MYQTIQTQLNPCLGARQAMATLRLSFGSWRIRPLQVKPSELDGYGDYDTEQLAELMATASLDQAKAAPIPDVSAEEFDKLYNWFLS